MVTICRGFSFGFIPKLNVTISAYITARFHFELVAKPNMTQKRTANFQSEQLNTGDTPLFDYFAKWPSLPLCKDFSFRNFNPPMPRLIF